MQAQHLAKRFQVFQCVDRAGRIARAVDYQHFCFRRDRRFQLRCGQLETLRDVGFHDDRCAFRDDHDVGVGDPVRRGDDDLIARVDHCQCQIEEALFAAAGDQYLLGGVVEPVVALELGDDGFLERRRTAHGGVFGEARVDGR